MTPTIFLPALAGRGGHAVAGPRGDVWLPRILLGGILFLLVIATIANAFIEPDVPTEALMVILVGVAAFFFPTRK